jgi:hypothetical protein
MFLPKPRPRSNLPAPNNRNSHTAHWIHEVHAPGNAPNTGEKLPGTGTSPKRWPKKMRGRKKAGLLPNSEGSWRHGTGGA